MYKVFFNDCCLYLDARKQNSSLGNIDKMIDIQIVDDFFAFLCSIDCPKTAAELVSVRFRDERLLQATWQRLNRLPAAGGLVRNTRGEYLAIRRLGRWDLPKGKIEKEESATEAALREVEEECGLHGLSLVGALPSTFHLYRSPWLPEADNWVLKETAWFEMIYPGDEQPVPQTEEDITEIRWFAADELNEVVAQTYGSIADLLRRYLAELRS